MTDRAAHFVGSVLVIVGALVLGGVLHQVFVESSVALASARALLGLGGAAALVAVGWHLERRADPSEFVADPDPAEDGEEWPEEEYVFSDEELDRRSGE